MSRDEPVSPLSEDLAMHIFAVSAGLVGVCLTVIGLFRLSDRLQQVSGIGDEVLSVDSAVFLLSCILSYLALRTRTHRRRHRIERMADIVFFVGLCLMAVVCGLIAYELV